MAEIVELVAEKTVARAVEIRKKNARSNSGYRSVRLARKEAGEVTSPEGPPAALKESGAAQRVVVGEFGSDGPVPPKGCKDSEPVGESDEASEGESIEGGRLPEAEPSRGKPSQGFKSCKRDF